MDGIVIFCERPTQISLDERGRLHSVIGPAVSYENWRVYAVHGVRVPESIIERRETITPQTIESETNAEVRRVMIELYGQARYLVDSGANQIAADDTGVLYRKTMNGDEPLVMVKVVNSTPEPDGSRREYFLRVPPTMRTAREAVAWTFGLAEAEYAPEIES